MKYWLATCSNCGKVKIMQNTEPSKCQERVRSGYRSSRQCGLPLSNQEDVTQRFEEMRGFTSKRPQLECILDQRAMRAAFEVARSRWPNVELGYIGTDRTTFHHYFQEWGNPQYFILGA